MPLLDRIVGQDPRQLEEITCGICQDVLSHPKSTACCRQTYCNVCIDRWLSGHNTCPNDRQPLSRELLADVPRPFLNLIGLIRVRCMFADKGCPSEHTIGEDSDHSMRCQYNECSRCGHIGDKTGHDCLQHVLQMNSKLIFELDNLRSVIKLKDLSLKLTQRSAKRTRTESSDPVVDTSVELKPNDLVWVADKRGFWFPAVIVDPDQPLSDNPYGVTAIPNKVLNKRKNDRYLVSAFDKERNCGWTERKDLVPMGVDSQTDEEMLCRPTDDDYRETVQICLKRLIDHLSKALALDIDQL